MNKTESAVEYLKGVISPLCVDQEQLVIEFTINELGLNLLVSASTKDLPFLIGKYGMTANAIRQVLLIWGARHGAKVNFSIP